MALPAFTDATVVSATAIAASWGNLIRNGVTHAFATTGARDSAITAPTAGMRVVITGEDRIYEYSGSAWVRTNWYGSAGRTQCLLRRAANQAIGSGSLTAISWDTEDSDPDGFIAVTSSTLTVPAGLGGLYSITVGLTTSGDPGAAGFGIIDPSSAADIRFSLGGGNAVGAHNGSAGVTWIGPLAAAETVQISGYQNSGGSLNFTGYLRVYRLGN